MIGRSELPSKLIRDLLSRWPEEPPPLDAADAAVIAILRESVNELEVLLIERTENSQDPASGQVALPGGHVENGDRSLSETALRECGEEVGVFRSDLALAPTFVTIQLATVFSLRSRGLRFRPRGARKQPDRAQPG